MKYRAKTGITELSCGDKRFVADEDGLFEVDEADKRLFDLYGHPLVDPFDVAVAAPSADTPPQADDSDALKEAKNKLAEQDAIIQAQNSQVQRLAAVTKALGDAQEENQLLRDQKAALETSNQELSDQVLRLNNTIAAYEAAAAAQAEAAQAASKKGKS